MQEKDLIYKFGDFIEYNPEPKKYDIEKIEFQTSYCFGRCPKFFISIDKERNGIFRAEEFNQKTESSKEIKGTFQAVLSGTSVSDIFNLLNYIDFPTLENNYTVNWTDDQSCTLKITYSSGKIKIISDYGLIGSSGLSRLYKLIFELRFNEDWKKIP